MGPDLHELETFYASRQGQLARRLIGRQIRRLWPDLRGRCVLGLGHAGPFLSAFEGAERALAFALAPDGGLDGARLPADPSGRVALAREDELPLPDQSVDRVLLVHAVETSPSPKRLLREVWRVLADGGGLIGGGADRAGCGVPGRRHAVRARRGVQRREARPPARRPPVRAARRAGRSLPAADALAPPAAARRAGRAGRA